MGFSSRYGCRIGATVNLNSLQIGKRYISKEDIVVLIDIDQETAHVRCQIIKELDGNMGIPVGMTFDMFVSGFISQYSIYLDWDNEIDSL